MTTEKNQNAKTEVKKPRKSEVCRPDAPAVRNNENPEHGGPKGLEPTRYGDWERKGRCIDF